MKTIDSSSNSSEVVLNPLRGNIGKIGVDLAREPLVTVLIDDSEFEEFIESPKHYIHVKGLTKTDLDVGTLADLIITVRSRMFSLSDKKDGNDEAKNQHFHKHNSSATESKKIKTEQTIAIAESKKKITREINAEAQFRRTGKTVKREGREGAHTPISEQNFFPAQPLVTPVLVAEIKKRFI